MKSVLSLALCLAAPATALANHPVDLQLSTTFAKAGGPVGLGALLGLVGEGWAWTLNCVFSSPVGAAELLSVETMGSLALLKRSRVESMGSMTSPPDKDSTVGKTIAVTGFQKELLSWVCNHRSHCHSRTPTVDRSSSQRSVDWARNASDTQRCDVEMPSSGVHAPCEGSPFG